MLFRILLRKVRAMKPFVSWTESARHRLARRQVNRRIPRLRASSRKLKWSIVQHHELVGTQRQDRIGAAFVIAELDLEDAGGNCSDDRADLAARQTTLSQVLRQRHQVQKIR